LKFSFHFLKNNKRKRIRTKKNHGAKKREKIRKKQPEKNLVIGVGYVNSLNSLLVNSLPISFVGVMFIVLLGFEELVNIMVSWCLVGCSLVAWLSSSTLSQMYLPIPFPSPSSPH